MDKIISNLTIILMVTIAECTKTSVDYVRELEKVQNIELPPATETHIPTEVQVGFYVNSVNIDCVASGLEITLTMYLHQSWHDPRLQFSPEEYGGRSMLILPDGTWKKIWIPDLFFRDEISSRLHRMFRESVYFTVDDSGHTWFSTKLITRLHCPASHSHTGYPFASHQCPIQFESFRYSLDTMYFSWLSHPLLLDSAVQNSNIKLTSRFLLPDINQSVMVKNLDATHLGFSPFQTGLYQVPGYTLQNHTLHDCSENFSTGALPCMEVTLLIQQHTGRFFVHFLIPSMILVIASWLTFWMNPARLPERIGVLVLLNLSLILVHKLFTMTDAPLSRVVTSLDVWALMCGGFLLAAMLEATVVKVIRSTKGGGCGDDIEENSCIKCTSANIVVSKLDLISRLAFPVTFLVAIVIFFSVYKA